VNENDGVVSFVDPVGPMRMLVSGGSVSTVNVLEAGEGSVFPATSVA
jgi:hypothetical protein